MTAYQNAKIEDSSQAGRTIVFLFFLDHRRFSLPRTAAVMNACWQSKTLHEIGGKQRLFARHLR